MPRLYCRLLLIVVVGLSAVAGCNKGPTKYQVSGKVIYKDGSIPHGGVCSVQFTPTAGSAAEVRKGASGPIAPDGSFQLYTRTPGDGVYPGQYGVSFAVWAVGTNPA